MEWLIVLAGVATLMLAAYLRQRWLLQRWTRNHQLFMEVMALVMQHCPGGSHHDLVETRRSKPLYRQLWIWPGGIEVTLDNRQRQLVLKIGQDQVALTQVVNVGIAAALIASPIVHVELPTGHAVTEVDDERDTGQPQRASA